MFTGKDIKEIRKKFYESQIETWKKKKKKPKSDEKFNSFAKEIKKVSGLKGKLSGRVVVNPNK